MDLNQIRLNKTEWDSIEIPIREEEMRVVKMIMAGYSDLNIKTNRNISLASYLQMPTDIESLDDHLFKEYFEKTVRAIDPSMVPTVRVAKMRKSDLMKINLNKPENIAMLNVYETKLLDLVKSIHKLHAANRPFHIDYFTLYSLSRNLVYRLNRHVLTCVEAILAQHEDAVPVDALVLDAHNVIEKNQMLMHNEDTALYSHQRDIFHLLQNPGGADRVNAHKLVYMALKSAKAEFASAEEGDDDAVFFAAQDELKVAHADVNAIDNPSKANLVLYSAPTGTGKTLTPLALSQGYAVLFVCAARHVGLALAKSAISVGRKVAFAFGCDSADDIRLHYAAASVYSIHPRSGKIWKVDNSAGEKVQIMICDVKSYLCAMYYMRAFNPIDNLLTFWDEPTIGLDMEDHPLHEHIRKLWCDNIIPNVVMSSATLPNVIEIADTVNDFETRFGANMIDALNRVNTTTISSHDCKKTIPLIDKAGYSVMPHYMADNDYEMVCKSATHCKENPTLLRYLDLEECVRFIAFAEKNAYIAERYTVRRRFAELSDVTMTNVKLHYINTVLLIKDGCWGAMCLGVRNTRKPKLMANVSVDGITGARITKSHSIGPGSSVFTKKSAGGAPLQRMESITPTSSAPMNGAKQDHQEQEQSQKANPGVYITTKDAYTLTDGPTLFLTDDIEKIAKFYLKQSYIPASTLSVIIERIEFNNSLSERISEVEQKLETLSEKLDTAMGASADKAGQKGSKGSKGSKSSKKETKSASSRDTDDSRTTLGKLNQDRTVLYNMIKNIELNEIFVPNKVPHLERWAQTPDTDFGFTSDISSEVICQIMAIEGVNDTWKILLLMGIGVFANHNSQSYTEIMKRMADEQRLYLIIASSDYIYGTNYQFCHGYLGKDVKLTQQKAIQSIGRVGRNNIQQTYSVRLRDDAQAMLLLMPSENNVEVRNMNRLFVSSSSATASASATDMNDVNDLVL